MKRNTLLKNPEISLIKLLDQYNVQTLVLDKLQDRQLIRMFRNQSNWSLDYEDDSITLFWRTNQKTTRLQAK